MGMETWEILESVLDITDPAKPKLRVDATIQVEHIDIGNVGILDSADVRMNPAKEDGNLATIVTNTNKIPASPATEGGNLATIVTNTNKIPASPATEGGNLAGIKGDLDTMKGGALTFVSGQATSSGPTSIISAVTLGKHRIKSIMFNNAGAADVSADLLVTIGTSKNVFPVLLKSGSIFSRKMTPDFIECDINTAVSINLSGAGTVNYHVEYVTI